MINKTIIRKIDKGATLIYTRKENDPFVSITYGFKVGSINEDDSTRGISHFIEHMHFNGTKNYSKEQLMSLPETYGGDFNANTCEHVTQYEVQVLKQHFKEGLHFTNDLALFPTFPLEYLDKEKNIVIQEIRQSEDSHWDVILTERNKLFHKSNLQHSVLGYEDIINNLTREDLISYHKKYYTTSNLIISICGDMDIEYLIAEIEKLLPESDDNIINRDYDCIETSSNLIIKEKEGITQCKLMKSFFIPNDKRLIFNVCAHVLGGGMNSRLFDTLRENQGLCYQVGAFIENHNTEKDLFTMFISYEDECKTEHILNEMDRIVEEFISTNIITDDELLQAKSFILGETYRDEETSRNVSCSKVRRYVFNSNLNIEKNIKSLQALTKDDITNNLKKYYKKDKTICAILKPKKS